MKKNNDHLTVKKGLVIFAVLFVLLYIIIYIVPRVFDIFTSTYLAEYGTLEVKQEAECLIVRNEKVYKAPSESGFAGGFRRRRRRRVGHERRCELSLRRL